MDFAASGNPLAHECPQCGSTRLVESLVNTTIWHGDRLVVVEGIPAIVCTSCGERFYDDATATMIDLMRGDDFPVDRAVRHVSVPVFRYAHRVPEDLTPLTEADA